MRRSVTGRPACAVTAPLRPARVDASPRPTASSPYARRGVRASPLTTGAMLRVNRSLAIPMDEIEWRATTSGGPGGQHANRTSSRVEVRFDVDGSRALGPRQRARLLERLGPVVRAAALGRALAGPQPADRPGAAGRPARRRRCGSSRPADRPGRPRAPRSAGCRTSGSDPQVEAPSADRCRSRRLIGRVDKSDDLAGPAGPTGSSARGCRLADGRGRVADRARRRRSSASSRTPTQRG